MYPSVLGRASKHVHGERRKSAVGSLTREASHKSCLRTKVMSGGVPSRVYELITGVQSSDLLSVFTPPPAYTQVPQPSSFQTSLNQDMAIPHFILQTPCIYAGIHAHV